MQPLWLLTVSVLTWKCYTPRIDQMGQMWFYDFQLVTKTTTWPLSHWSVWCCDDTFNYPVLRRHRSPGGRRAGHTETGGRSLTSALWAPWGAAGNKAVLLSTPLPLSWEEAFRAGGAVVDVLCFCTYTTPPTPTPRGSCGIWKQAHLFMRGGVRGTSRYLHHYTFPTLWREGDVSTMQWQRL